MKLFRALALSVMSLSIWLNPSISSAQTTNAAITGRITDPSKAVLVDAHVAVINTGTNVRYEGRTNNAGSYVIPGLPPGPYRVEVEKPGFRTIVETGVVLHVQDTVELNYEMALGTISESITVTADTNNVNTTDASVSTVIDRNFVESLPLSGRSFNTLLQLTPGVVIAPSDNGGGNPGQFSIAGQRTDSNNFTVDGVSANFGVSLGTAGYLGAAGTGSAQAFSVLGGTSSLVSVDALQEFRIETSSFAPEFGRQPGGQVLLTTRSGTNDFHGGLFEYFRNDVMDANNWFANQANLPRAEERHNDFGGFLGGPIVKGKTFLFLSYEGARLRQPQTEPIQVPSEYARTYAAANTPSLAPFLNAYPKPDDLTVTPGVYTAEFSGNFSNSATLNAGSIRIDHIVNDHISIFGRFNEAPSIGVSPSLSLSTSQGSEVDTRTLTLGMNMLVTLRISNSLRGNYSTQSANTINSLTSLGGAIPLEPSMLIGSLSGTNTLGDFATFDTTDLRIGPVARNSAKQLTFVDDLSVTIGTHQLKFGGDYRAIFTTTDPEANSLSFTASSVQDFLSSGQVSLYAGTWKTARFVTPAVSLYAQDTWNSTRRLTVTYGIRWELDPAPSPRQGTQFGVWNNVNDPLQIDLAPPGTPLWKTTYHNLAPRIGIAYAPNEKRDFVLRVGGGIFYDLGVGTSANVATTFPSGVLQFTPSVTLPATDLSPYLPVISLQPPYTGLIYAFAPDLRLPRSYEWNLALEKSFAGHQAVSATYVGQVGKNLLRQEGLAAPNSNFAPSALFYVTQNDASSTYNALQLQYRRPLASRVQALVNYTWSHSLDDASDDTAIAVSNTVFSNKNDWGSAGYDVRHSFSGAVTLDVPALTKSGLVSRMTKDWSLDGLVVARGGFPLNAVLVTLGPIGAAYPRPDVVPGQPFWVSTPGAPGGKVLNPAAFSAPQTLQQGNEGRNDIAGFGLTQVDFSVGRKFPITERLNLQFRADAFNLLNHPNFTNPLAYVGLGPYYLQSQTMLSTGLGGLNPLFQEGGPRSLQLSLRLTF